MNKIIKVLGTAVFAVAFAACAQQGGGLTTPVPSSIAGHKNVVPSVAALTLESTQFCNAEAQVDYASIVLYCTGQTPSLPVSVTTNYVTEWSKTACQVYGYVDATNKLIAPATVSLANCPTGIAPAPVVAPSGASAVK